MTRELVGAAARYTTRTAKTSASTANPARARQTAAWDYYATTPEVRFYANWVGNGMSRARLYAGRHRPDGTIERAPDEHPAAQHVASIAGGPDGQAQLLRDYGRHLAVAGEGWTIVQPRRDAPADWRVLSVLEINSRAGQLEAEIDGTTVKIPAHNPDAPPAGADDDPVAIRVWDPSPRHHLEADSPILSSLDQLEELRLLSAAIRAVARSRLTGRGVLLVPQGTRFPTAPGQSDAQDDLIDVFMEVAETAYRDPESAAATVPIVLEVPPETISGIQRLTFESDFDELAIKLREEIIRRIATGADIPAEILLGQGDVNHWGAWALQEEAIRLGIEPRLSNVSDALTTQWLQPLLEGDNVPDAGEWLVWADSSPLRVRSNRSQTALEVYRLGAITAEALRRETGFDEADAPTIPPAPQRDQPQEDRMPTPTRLPVDETTGEPNTLPASAAATLSPVMLAAADGLIWHALSHAGEKLLRTPACPRSRRGEARQIAAAARHTCLRVGLEEVDDWGLLDGALDRAPEIATRYVADPECFRASVDNYCRELLAAGVEHDYAHVAAAVGSCLTEAA